jgi:hypothetical protein
MPIYSVVFELRRPRNEYRQFFKKLDDQQSVTICSTCRLLFSNNSPEAIKNYLQNFIFPGDIVFVADTDTRWALNKNFEATEWLRELQSLHDARAAMLDESEQRQPPR